MNGKVRTIAVAASLVVAGACSSGMQVKRYESQDDVIHDYAVLALSEFNLESKGTGQMALYDLQNYRQVRRRIHGNVDRVVISFPHREHRGYYAYCVLELENGTVSRVLRRAYCTIDIDNPKHPVFKPDDDISGECLMCVRGE